MITYNKANVKEDLPNIIDQTEEIEPTTVEDFNLDEASRSAQDKANMRTFASNVAGNNNSISIEELPPVEEIEGDGTDYLAEEIELKDEIEVNIATPDLQEEEEAEGVLDFEDHEEMEEVTYSEEDATEYFDDPDNFDTEDIDEAYRKRLIALGLEPLEPIMTSSDNTSVEAPLVADEIASTLPEFETDLEVEEEVPEAEANPEVDEALTNLFANPPVVPLPKTPTEPVEELATDAHFSPLNFQDNDTNAPTQEAKPLSNADSKASMLQQFRQLQDRNSTFVFMFGRQQAGKTVILSSLAYHMGVDENGLLETRRRVDNLKGAAYLKQLSQSVRKGQFMNRTAVGSLYELDLTYTPNKPEVPMNFTFLEMSGEDLSKLMQSEKKKHNRPTGLILDESSHLKKGKYSVGVARQYAGTIGKVDNCQVGVYASLCNGKRPELIG